MLRVDRFKDDKVYKYIDCRTIKSSKHKEFEGILRLSIPTSEFKN